MNEEIEYVPVCPVCDGYGLLLGVLGYLMWYRCRDCGAEFSEEVQRGRD